MFNSLNFYRYIRNYLTISAQGGFSERFLNLCNKNKISIWNLKFNKNGFTANVYGKDFSRIRHLARKSGVSLKIISKSGLHFNLHKHRKRKGLLIGAIFALFFMLLMNLFVWEIEITGSENISREKVMSVIKKVGLEYGTFSPAFDRIDASRNAINIFDGDILGTIGDCDLLINAETGDIAAYSCKDSTDSLEYNVKETKKKKIMRGNG